MAHPFGQKLIRLLARLPGWGRGEAATARRIGALLDARAPLLRSPRGVPGLAAVVGLPSGARVRRFYGSADPRRRRPVEASTSFRVLSLSKPVTAFGVVRLAEEGVLELDAPLLSALRSWTFPPERLAGFDPAGVTLRRLLSHTAGLAPVDFPWAPSEAPPGRLLDGEGDPGARPRLVYPPGAGALYSGVGYVLAELAVEEATGRSFAEILRDRVLNPLGMKRSAFREEDWLGEALAVPHDLGGAPLEGGERPVSAGSSGLRASADDLATFLSCLSVGPAGEPAGRGVVSPAGAALLTTAQPIPPGADRWALGFRLREAEGETLLTHGGFRHGWWSRVAVLLRRRACVVLLSNGEGGAGCVKPLMKEIRRVLLRMRVP